MFFGHHFDHQVEDFKTFLGLRAENLKQVDTFWVQVATEHFPHPIALPPRSYCSIQRAAMNPDVVSISFLDTEDTAGAKKAPALSLWGSQSNVQTDHHQTLMVQNGQNCDKLCSHSVNVH